MMTKGQLMKRSMATAVTAALLTLPLSATLTLADTVSSTPATTATTTVAPAADTAATSTTNATATAANNSSTTSSAITGTIVDENGTTVAPENWLSDLLGKIQLLLTFDPVKKATIDEHHALARLAEAKELLQEGNIAGAEASLTQYSDKITQAQDFINQVKDPNSDAAKKLVIALSNVNANNIQVLSSLLDKLPPQAAQRLALNLIRSMEKAVTRLQAENTNSTTAGAIAASTTPTTTSETTTAAASTNGTNVNDTKALEKQAKIALEKFKKSLNQKGNLKIEDQDQDEDQDKDQDQDKKQDNVVPQQVQPTTQAPAVQSTTVQGTTSNGTMMPSNQSNSHEVRSSGSGHRTEVKKIKGNKEDKEDQDRD